MCVCTLSRADRDWVLKTRLWRSDLREKTGASMTQEKDWTCKEARDRCLRDLLTHGTHRQWDTAFTSARNQAGCNPWHQKWACWWCDGHCSWLWAGAGHCSQVPRSLSSLPLPKDPIPGASYPERAHACIRLQQLWADFSYLRQSPHIPLCLSHPALSQPDWSSEPS